MSRWAAVVLACTAVVLCVAVIHVAMQPEVELGQADGIVRDVDTVIERALHGTISKRRALARHEPRIVTALDVMDQPHYAAKISNMASLRAQAAVDSELPHSTRTVSQLRAEQEQLEAKLQSMLKHGVHSASVNVDKVLKTQARIASTNKAEIHKDLTVDEFDPAHAPAFHSKALNRKPHVVDASNEVATLEKQLARKIAASERLTARNPSKVQGPPSAVESIFLPSSSSAKKQVTRMASLASTDASDSSPSSSIAPIGSSQWSWNSSPDEDSVAYQGMRDDALPTARDSLDTVRNRVTSRLQTQLNNAKQRLDRFRTHWSVHMPDDLRRATNEGWSSQYGKDYLNQGKTRSDLADEERLMSVLGEDMHETLKEERRQERSLLRAQEKTKRIQFIVEDLRRRVAQDKRDLSVAKRNAISLRRHLPEYFDDISDTDYSPTSSADGSQDSQPTVDDQTSLDGQTQEDPTTTN